MSSAVALRRSLPPGPSVLAIRDDAVVIVSIVPVAATDDTRALILELAAELDIPAQEKRVSPSELHCADEVFTTGTMGEVRAQIDV